MYTPTGSIKLDSPEALACQMRLCFQGGHGTGKTWAAVTFPNPVVLSFDRGLLAHLGRSDILEVPFWDNDFVKKIPGVKNTKDYINRKDALILWLLNEATQLAAEQTLVVDGSTGIQNAYHKHFVYNPVFSKRTSSVDERAEWGMKIPYFTDVWESLKTLRCHVIYIIHEQPERNDAGDITGKVKPLLSGQAGDQIGTHFTDIFRHHVREKTKMLALDEKKMMDEFGMDKKQITELCAEEPGQLLYLWQTMSDDKAACKTTLKNPPRYIKADYNTYMKWKRKPISSPQ